MISEVKARLGENGLRGEMSVINEIAEQKAIFMEKWMPLLTSNEEPITQYRVIWDFMNTVDRKKTVITHDAGSPRDQITPFYESLVPHGYMGWGKTTQLGMGMGLMHGAKLANPDWNCFNFMGDAAIGMVGMDFETAVRNKIGTTTVVFRNHVMGGYTEYHAEASKKYGIHKLGGDYVAMAKAFGGYAERVEKPADIISAIKRCIEQNDQGMPALLEIITTEERRFAKNLPDLDKVRQSAESV